MVTLDRFGNTAAASIPVALDLALEEGPGGRRRQGAARRRRGRVQRRGDPADPLAGHDDGPTGPRTTIPTSAPTATSMLDLLDDAATGHGTVHFVGQEVDPTLDRRRSGTSRSRRPAGSARRVGAGGDRRHGAHQHPRLCRARSSARGAPAARSRHSRCRRGGCRRRPTSSSSRGSARPRARPRSCSTRSTPRCSATPPLPVHTFDETAAGGPAVVVRR